MDKKEERFPESFNTPKKGFSRRNFLKGTTLTTAGMVVSNVATARGNYTEKTDELGPDAEAITLNINGNNVNTLARPDEILTDTLRERLDMTGTKLVCGRGACSACTIMVDDQLVCSCLTLTVETQGKKIKTIEGVADGNTLHPVQAAFIEEDAAMCGYCTPGMVMSCTALLDQNPNPNLMEVKKAIRGNLCRCGTYPHVFKAVLKAAEKMG